MSVFSLFAEAVPEVPSSGLVSLGLSEISFERFGPKGGVPERFASKSSAPSLDWKPDTTVQNTVTLGREYSPADITRWRSAARAGDPRHLFGLYDEMDRLAIGTQRTKAVEEVKGATVTFSAPEPFDNDDDEKPNAVKARRIRDYSRRTLARWMPTFLEHAFKAMEYRCWGSWIKTDPRGDIDGLPSITSVEALPARRFRIDEITKQWLFMPDPLSIEGVPVQKLVDEGSLIFWEFEKHKPIDQSGLLWQCLVPWGFLQYGVRWLGKLLEIFGIPILVGRYPNEDTKARALLEKLLPKLRANGWLAIPDGANLEVRDPMVAGRSDHHMSAIEWCLRLFDQIFCGHSQASGAQVGAGSRTSSDVASEGFKKLTNSRCATIAGWITEQVLRPLVARAFGDQAAKLFLPVIVARVLDRENPKELAETAKLLKDAGAGEQVDAVDLVKRTMGKVARKGAPNLGASAAPVAAPAVADESLARVLRFPFRAASTATDTLERLEGKALQLSRGSADALLEPYAKLIDEVERDGGDLGHLAYRIRLQASKDGKGKAEIAELIRAILLEAVMTGFTEKREEASGG